MAAKLPAKFDDVAKSASSVLGDDFQCSGFQLKAKQATNFGGATSDITVDYDGKADTKTPAKMSFKFPKPVPMLEGLAIDKFELDKKGVMKVESSLSKALHGVDGLKIEVKTDFGAKTTYGSVFTGYKDAMVKFETSHSAPTDFTVECLHARGSAVVGAQLKGTKNLCPSVAASYQHGDIFASVVAKEKFSEFTAHALYSLNANNAKLVATYQHGGKTSGSWTVGGSAGGLPMDMSAKAKFDGSLVSMTVKKDLAKGTKLFCGLGYNLGDGNMTTGAKLSIE